jgi:uncharacterized membrane protein (UPF0127 family)
MAHRSKLIAFLVPALMVLLSALLTLLVQGCSSSGSPDLSFHRVRFLPSKVSIRAEAAETEPARRTGLMHRTSLDENEGMIFYFADKGLHSFYMYNTKIHLSVIFLDETLRIVDIQDMDPCPSQNPSECPIYTPRSPCRYAIEVNQGFVRKHGIKTGDLVEVTK